MADALGDQGATPPIRTGDDLESRVRERAVQLFKANASLESEVRDRRSAEAQIKALFKRLITVQEEERRRIARDIHDHVGQQLTALRINLASLASQAADHPAIAEQTERLQQLAEELDRSIDFLTWQLRPATLDHLGLAAALQDLVAGWSQRFGVGVDFDCYGVDGLRLSSDAETHLYRITQEALHNIAKHAGASNVCVSLVRSDHQLALAIEDDGNGFEVEAVLARHTSRQLGLLSMRERARLLGGDCEMESALQRGTSIVVRLPIEDASPTS
jgi:signal transduction histidine kinase